MPPDSQQLAPRRLLLIQLRAMGDVVLTTPALRVLKRHFPQAEIDFITNPPTAELLSTNPHLHQAIAYPHKPQDVLGALRFAFSLRKRRYDIAIDFLGTAATALMCWASRAPIRVGYNLRLRNLAYTHYDQNYRGNIYNALTKFSLLKPLGITEEEQQTEIVVPAAAQKWAADLFAAGDGNQRPAAAIAPYAFAPARRWLPERFAAVADWLKSQGFQVIFTWGPGEREYVEKVISLQKTPATLSPETTLPQLAALLKRCGILICNCSGTKHVAVAVGTPTLTIFGPSDPRVWHPPEDPRHIYLRAPLDCLTCGKDECEDLRCMEQVTSEQVINAVKNMKVLGEAP